MASQELLSVGRQCSHQTCNLVDFLPFKCQHCNDSFCQEHFMVAAHKCPKYDESKYNRVSPNCPLCNVVVAVRPGQDANEAVETHFVRDCSVMTGKAKARSTPVCARPRCGKALFAPIRCTSCSQQFCASHRFPADHTCVPVANATKTTTGPTAASRLLDLNTKASAAGGAALKSIKTMASNAQAQASASRPAAPPKPAAAAAPSKPNLFSKTDRRARAERESRRKAMHERAKKGLLSEEEKLALAREEAEDAQQGGGDGKKDCVIM
ncbi:hypothetical protein DFH08DRAFT_835930 [Mycena albidolilacea]|uniref:AN1-type domain-containing protein n=1 Tax=Mycena albidolilacea TaxID=1033008 RepID=A0AAD7F5R1_9AGAR|nr:hypothetical protein DFH08DRAFT_835930 [Mycena albidolilacea]